MNAKNDFIFVIAVLGILAAAWVISGGPERGGDISFSRSESAGQIRSASDIERKIGELEREFENIRDRVVDTARLKEQSNYAGMVEIEVHSRGVDAVDPAREYVTLVANHRNTSNIPLSGWTIESIATNRGAEIGMGTRLPLEGNVNVERDILLAPGEEAVITSGRSPIGASFRTNMCTGYLGQFQTFTPSLNRSCPLPTTELQDFAPLEARTDDKCIDYLEGVGRCRVPLSGLPLGSSGACQTFVARELSYNGCVERHKGDEDFYGSEWRIFLGKGDEMWRDDREIIRLADRDGKTVDLYIY